MRNKLIGLILVLSAFTICVNAQSKPLKFGHINSKELMVLLPEMDAAMSKLEALNTNNNEQLKKMQAELKRKSESFTAEQESLPDVVKGQRQQELQQMDQNMRAFYQGAQQEMQQKEQELTLPIIEKAQKAIEEVGKENGFTYIFDIANGDILFQGAQSIDVMPLMKKKLGLIVN